MRRKHHSGFTLIELLVVVAIIASIASILFPVFSQAREKARQASCLSNAKQLTLGVLMYAQDYDETLTPTQDDSFTLWPTLLYPYIKNAQVSICPSDAGGVVNSYGLDELTFVDETDFLPDPPPALTTLAEFATPASTVMVGELGTQDDLVTSRLNAYKLTVPDDDLNDQYDGRPAGRHFGRSNLGFMDGHDKAVRIDQFYGTPANPGQTFTPTQTPPDLWFCFDPSNVSSCTSN